MEPNILHIPQRVPSTLADAALEAISTGVPWSQGEVTLYGRTHKTPRLQCWLGDVAYKYSGMLLQPVPWSRCPAIDGLRTNLRAQGHDFNSALVNLYRDGQDTVGWHSDDEPELGPDPVIASLSFGSTRDFILRNKRTREKRTYVLGHGDLLVMGRGVQSEWEHSLPRRARVDRPRVNVTFRTIMGGQV